MTRKEVYAEIKKQNLEEKIKLTFNKNYTNCSTAALQSFIDNINKKNADNKHIVDAGARKAIKAIADILNIKNIEKYF
jgi:hypothetical protein